MYAGQVATETETFARGNFILHPCTVKSLAANAMILNFIPKKREVSKIAERVEGDDDY